VESALRQGAGDPGLTLIETLGWTGAAFPRLALHVARLTRSAVRLGWPCDPAAMVGLLQGAVGPAPARVRLTLDREGRFSVQVAAMPQAGPVWTLTLAPTRLTSGDPWLTLKSSRRTQYDTARAALPATADEAIFLNERGEVCDGTITTLFFDPGQGMRTPPLSCGLLPGVLRAELALPEQVLLAADLPQVRLWVGNSLRGLIPAVWAG